jgi:signal transduction histidine kinase
MLASLRSKLFLSHFLVILLAFLLAALVAVVPLRRVQTAAEEARLQLSAESVARQIDLTRQIREQLPGERASGERVLQAIIDAEQRQTDRRVLLAERDGTVQFDSAITNRLIGVRLPGLSLAIQRVNALAERAAVEDGDSAAIVIPREAVSVPVRSVEEFIGAVATTSNFETPPADRLYVVTLAPERRLPVFDRGIAPFVLAGGVAAIVSIPLAFLLARTISHPVTRLTRAARAIAAGDLTRRVPGRQDKGEVGTLVHAFNTMVERLEQTYESQRQLLANVAHELRTPLTSIQGYAQALRDGVLHDDAERDEALLAITEETGRMGDLVNQILQLSRLESGQSELSLSEFKALDLLERLRRQFQPLAARANVALSFDAPDELRLHADEELLLQALGNLIGNGLRHTPSGGSVTVRASVASGPAGARLVRFSVGDSGAGIPSEQLERIFERFYRGGGASAARRFGLGLAIVREVVARHNGTISVDSSVGQGTTFTIDLPNVALDGPASG